MRLIHSRAKASLSFSGGLAMHTPSPRDPASGKDGISRGIYVTVKDKRVIVLRVFLKKTQKTPKNELDIAKQRAKEAGLI
ncbi:MAG: hypothetical protein EB072_05175 [Betaproteobacteria bacterium]|nr:hypothetical protein [Betaproteobacteria bacterium]